MNLLGPVISIATNLTVILSPKIAGVIPKVRDRLPLFYSKSDMETIRANDQESAKNLGEFINVYTYKLLGKTPCRF